MSWDALAAIGEIIGAIAVVVTLLYLAGDIHQNSRAMAGTALRDTSAQGNHWSDMLPSSPDLADIVASSNRSYTALTESEALGYGDYVQAFFDNVESYLSMVVDYRVEKDIDVLQSIVRRHLAHPGFREWWPANTADYSQDNAVSIRIGQAVGRRSRGFPCYAGIKTTRTSSGEMIKGYTFLSGRFWLRLTVRSCVGRSATLEALRRIHGVCAEELPGHAQDYG